MKSFSIVVCLISCFFINLSLANPEASIKEGAVPALFSAIEKEDKELYEKEMKLLLDGSIKDFVETVGFKTKEGNNVFHLMAGVRTHQSFFAGEIQNLYHAFQEGRFDKNNPLSLGGVTISIPDVQDIELGKALIEKNMLAIVSITESLGELSAAKWFQTFHGIAGFDYSYFNYQGVLNRRGEKQLVMEQRKKIKEFANIFDTFPLGKNKERLSPKMAAYNAGNESAYTFLRNMGNMPLLVGSSVGAFSGIIIGIEVIPSESHAHPLALAGGMVGGLAAGGFIADKCYQAFERMKIKKLKKTQQ